MAARKTQFATGEFYHVYNRGVDKRTVFDDEDDIQRFFQGMIEFNVLEPIGSVYENSFRQLGSLASKLPVMKKEDEKLVNFVAFCLNPNHYHFLLEQVAEKGIEKFMQRLGTGHTKYFNHKYERSGSLFQGVFKSVHIDTNEYLLHLSAYINLNDRVHKLDQLGSEASKLVRSQSSWGEYVGEKETNFCEKNIILDQFESQKEYQKFAEDSLENILKRKEDLKEIESFLLE